MTAHSSFSHILDFANRIDFTSPILISELRTKLPIFPLNDIPTKQCNAFEVKGTEIWNLATRHRRKQENTDDQSEDGATKITLLRVYAFGMLESAATHRMRKHIKEVTCSRVLKLAFKCVKACLEGQELDFASKVASRAAEWLEKAEHVVPEEDIETLRAEYFIWRMALAWKQDKVDVAEHMWDKYQRLKKPLPESAEELSDVLFELGKDLSERKHFELAATWLERALDTIDSQDLDRLSEHAGDLRLAVVQKLVKCLLAIKTEVAMEKARSLLTMIDQSYSDKLIAALLRLELLSMESSPDATTYFEVVSKMIRSIMLTRTNFKTIMHHIHKLKKLNDGLACKALEELITGRLLREAREEWIERACMLRIWIVTTGTSDPGSVALKKALDDICEIIAEPFSVTAAHAAQTFLWGCIETAFNSKRFSEAETFCTLALHPLFEKSGELNRGKIGRKAMSCALARADASTARGFYFQLPESQRNSAETRYLTYKAAMRMNDAAWAAESLAIVSKQVNKDPTLLYGCVLDAIQIGDSEQAYQALNKVLEAYDNTISHGVNLPALLRCMIRLIRTNLRIVRDNPVQFNESVETMTALFEVAAKQAANAGSAQNDFTYDELSWFCKNSYNVAMEYLAKAHPRLLYRLCLVCSSLVKRLDREMPLTEESNLKLKHAFCDYLAMSIAIVLARTEDNIDAARQWYVTVLQHSDTLRELITELMKGDLVVANVKADLIGKHIQTTKFALEAALRLERWNMLPPLFDTCWTYDDPKRWDTLADLAFKMHEAICNKGPEVIQFHQKVVLEFIEQIINKSWKLNESIDKLAKHMRCLFHLTLSKENGMAAKCVDQVVSVAIQCKQYKVQYPQDELEWIAATSFNHAVSCFCVKDDASCQFWAEKALNLAAHVDDNGRLSAEMQQKYSRLQWNDK